MSVADRIPYWLEKLPEGGYLCRFPDLPEFVPEGPSIEKLLSGLQGGLLTALEERIRSGLPLPQQRPLRAGEEYLSLSPTYSAKLQLIASVKEQQISSAELARRLDCLPQEAARILKLSHPTKIDTIAAAVAAVGGHLVCRITFD